MKIEYKESNRLKVCNVDHVILYKDRFSLNAKLNSEVFEISSLIDP